MNNLETNHSADAAALSRRRIIQVGSTVFASGGLAFLHTMLTGCGGGKSSTTSSTSSSSTSTSNTSTSSSSCEEVTNLTRGPYFVDNANDSNVSGDVVDTSIPERSDIRTDTKGSEGQQSGLPLDLTITVGEYGTSACTPLSGAQVMIWHCNAQGLYSDESVEGTSSSNYLRGYQHTDSSGQVKFTTIYPGWYQGRTVHIHLKIRVFNSSSVITTEATTQLFFDDTTSNAVYASNSAYKGGSRDTTNSADSIYLQESPSLLVTLSGSTTSGYSGTISIAVNVGTIYGG
jgi:protocatechuate 3,4-dioxygenase beta subunit